MTHTTFRSFLFLEKTRLLLFGLLLLTIISNAQNIYSRKTGNWDDNTALTGTWSLLGHSGLACSCTPGPSNTVIIGSGHVVTYRSGTPAATTIAGLQVNDSGGGTLTFGNAAASATTLTITGDVTINAGGTFNSSAGAASHTLNVGGNFTNNNIFNFGANTTVAFNGSSAKTLSGSGGTFTFQNVTLNTSASSNVNVNSSILINGTLNFNANGLFIVDANSNITLSGTTTITNNNASRYIQLDAGGGTNSQLIKINNNSLASWQIVFPVGTATGGYTPLDLTAANGASMTTAPTVNSTLSVKPVYNASVQGELRRVFRLKVSNNANATTFANADFYYNTGTDVSQGDVIGNYTTLWYLNFSAGAWASLTGTVPGAGFFSGPTVAQSLSTGTYYYTIGTSTAYPTTWYTYQDGVWSDPDVWTLDPSGTTILNPLSQSPFDGDEVVILNGYTITVDVNNTTLGSTTIQGGGTLDMVATTGHNLGTVSGSGLLRINSTTLPSGNYSLFVGSNGGTVEYYDIGGTLSATQTTYNKLKFTNTTNAGITYITASNLTVNGTLDITQLSGTGTVTWQINDGTAAARTISLLSDVTVSLKGQIRVGTGNSGSATSHSVTMYGNLINNGSIKFFDATDATFSDANYTGGSIYTAGLRGNTAAVTFSGVNNTTVTSNNQTDFYKLIVNKGTGQQAVLTVNSSNTANFRLFAPANRGSNTGTAPNEVSDNALQLVNGTLQLTGNITVPLLAANGTTGNDYFSIPQNAGLWINDANVSVTVANNSGSNDDQRLMLDGLLRVSNGTMSFGNSKGLGSGAAGVFLLEGGTVTTWQFRARAGGTGIFAYKQTGGTFNVGYTYALDGGVDGGSDARFDLSSTSSSFQMNGGVINIAKPTSVGGNGIFIACSTSNYNVTGGTINVYTGLVRAGTDNTFSINSTVPFYNLTINRESGATSAQLLTNGLTVLNDLTIVTASSPVFNCGGLNLTIGGNFVIQSSTTFTPGANTLTFNGTGAQTWTHDGTITSLNNVVVNKSSGILTLSGGGTFPNITGATTGLTLSSGTLDDGGKTVTVTGAISNSGTHQGTGSIVVNGATTLGGANGTFGNLTLQTNNTIATTGDQTVTKDLRLINANTTLNIASYNLTVRGNIYSDGTTGVAFTATKRILNSGLHNAGGLTRKGSAGDLLFPVGSTTIAYTPVSINVTATTHGTITVRSVNGEHPVVTSANQSLQYYWRVTSSGYVGITNVTHKSYTFSSATKNGTLTTYRAARYDPITFTWATNNTTFNATAATTIPNFNTGTGWTGVTGDKLDGEYTCGNSAAFSAVTVYYSRQSGSWGATTSWSNIGVGNATAASSLPCAACPVVIGNGSGINHTITIDANNRSCGTMQLNTGSTLDCGTFTGLNFGANTGGNVTGQGTLRIASTGAPAVFPAGDFTNFVGTSGGTVEWYGNTKTLPTSGPAPQSISLATYYNLILNPSAGQTITLPASNLTVFNNLTTTGAGTVNTDATGARTITINGNLAVNSGTLSIRNGNVTNFVLSGNTTINPTASFSVQGGGTRTHTFTTSDGITNNGTLLFRSGTELVNITFTGSNNVSFTGTNAGASTTLNTITLNKGTSQAPTLTFDIAGTVTTLTNAWLTLSNGTFTFNNANTYTLSTATTAYTIPATACLKVQAGTVTILNAANNNSDLSLIGKLQVAGGIVNVGASGNNINNDIEYASAGSPTIDVSSGALYVNGSIRRSTSTISGGLVYNQTGGTVTVAGRNTATTNTRGVFEIDNNLGSSFTLTGNSALQILRPNGGTSYADLFLNPETSNVAATSTIEIGLNSGTAQAFRVSVAPSLGNFTVVAGGAGAQTVTLFSNPLVIAADLLINTNGTLVTNSLDVSLAGDLTIDGTYNGSANTTTFNGSANQNAALSASSTFQNITINNSGGGTITLSGTSPTITNLNILNGILNVGTLGLTVNGDIVNNSSQIGSGSIVMSGTSTLQNITSGNGSFTNLTLGGSATSKNVVVSGDLSILGSLTFSTTNRFLTIGDDLLTFGTAGSISGAGATAFIRSNGVSSDLGVTKIWNTGASSFTYAVGTLTNYTPVTVTLNVSAGGSLNVIPVNERHPTYNVASSERILNYYWIVTRGSTLSYSATGSHVYSYAASLIGGTGGTLVAGYLDISNPTGWITSAHGGTATTTTMTFTNLLGTNLPTAGNTYHLSAGTVNTLPNPIIPVYSRLTNASVSNPAVGGNWTDPTCWTTASNGMGAALTSAPYGVPVVILSGARINVNATGRIAFTSKINGLLVVGTKVGHNLGILSGTGTMQMSTNTFPAGNYTTYVSSAGGTIEYVGPMTMNNRSTYNNVSIIGSGSVLMTNTNLTLNGSMTIASGATLNNSANNRNMTVAKNWTNNGTYTVGTGSVTLNGTSAQAVSGSTSFYDLIVNNTASNITLSGTGTTTVTNSLTMTSGNIISSSTHPLALSLITPVVGGSASSFISGPVIKTLAGGSSFTFPLGSVAANLYRPAQLSNTSGADTWTLEYTGNDPTTNGFTNTVFNTAELGKVSMFEYWQISRAGATTSDVTLTYNTGSYIPPDIGVVANLRVVRWNGTMWDLPPGGGSFSQSGNNITGTVTVTNVTSFSPFTFGSLDSNSPLPVKLIYFKGARSGNDVVLDWKTAQELNSDKFEVQRSRDGLQFTKVGVVKAHGTVTTPHTYRFSDSEASPYFSYYYRLNQIDYSGAQEYSNIIFIAPGQDVSQRWIVYPNPVHSQVAVKELDPLKVSTSARIVVISSSGALLFDNTGPLTALSDKINALFDQAGAGVYMIRVWEGSYNENFRVVKY